MNGKVKWISLGAIILSLIIGGIIWHYTTFETQAAHGSDVEDIKAAHDSDVEGIKADDVRQEDDLRVIRQDVKELLKRIPPKE